MHTATRITTQQQSTYQIVIVSNEHLSADQVHMTAIKAQPRLSRATVYRNLDKLVSQGMLQKVTIDGVGYYEKQLEAHYHVVCMLCRSIANVHSPRATDIEEHFASSTDYKLVKHELVLYGICATCQR